ncbi:MAG TPA: DUF3667 domain-containing protein [Chitinophagaceae bacterium]|nr:DUF3667 domain-containing protein [Chitinophagaceae bacterium]
MSHRPERKERDCLNCGTTVHGKYCHVCGQENVEPKETLFGMVKHFFYDITHFDGKFFTSLKDLLFYPGFLSAEYMKGRRMSYLNPVKMYVFTSAVFFLIFFSIRGSSNPAFKITSGDEPLGREERDSVLQRVKEELREAPANYGLTQQLRLLEDTSKQVSFLDLLPYEDDFGGIGTLGGNYKSRKEYDSIQGLLPAGEKDGWIAKLWNKKAIDLNERTKHDRGSTINKVVDLALHKLPYLLFVSLPFFALILKLLYIRRKEFYYTDHGIFSVHHYILSFILLLFVFLWSKLTEITGWGIWNFLIIITVVAWPVYLYLAMRRFYRQGRIKTFIKFLLLNISGLIILVVLLVLFFLFSIFQL